MMLLRYLLIIFCCFAFACGAGLMETKIVGSYKYELYDDGLWFNPAIEACEKRNAWLLEIKDEEIDNAIASLTTRDMFTSGRFENGWKWNDGSPMLYTNWDGHAPGTPIEGNCLVISNGQWKYSGCNSGPKLYICQSDVSYPGSVQITLEETKNSYENAKTACENEDGYRLVDIKTSALDSYISIGTNSWTSGRYFEGSWRWGDGTPIKNDNSPWGTSQSGSSSNGDCLMKTVSNGWKSEKCTVEAGYICQKNVTSGDCSDTVCLNRGKCKIVGQRYSCTCNDAYFGTKCEKEIVNITSSETEITINKGSIFQTTFKVVSYDGNVKVKDINGDKILASTSEITGDRLTDEATINLGPLHTDVEYTVYAASNKARSRSITIVVVVVDHCKSNPCQNKGSCQYRTQSPYYNCVCKPAYEGSRCGRRIFVEKGKCKYHVNHDEIVTVKVANSTCKNMMGTLAMMKSNLIQDFVEEQVVKQYGAGGNTIYFFIGGVRYADSWHWIDDTPIPITGNDSKWFGPNQYKSGRSILVLSSHDKRQRSDMKWISKESDESYGYICEVPVDSSNICKSLQCENSGTCISVGCQESCHCASGYSGTHCKNEIFSIVAASQTFTSLIGQNLTVTLSIMGFTGSVKIDVFEGSTMSKKLFTKNNVKNTVDIIIGPFGKGSFGTNYWFRATPQSEPDNYHEFTNITVVVESPSKIESITPKMLAIPTETEQNVIRCNATGVPQPTVLWYKENHAVTNDSLKNIYQAYQLGHASLFVKSSSRLNFGNYTCYSYNVINAERIASNGTAFVQGKINLVTTTLSDEPLLGSASLTCIYEGYPKPDVEWRWLKDNDSIRIASNGIFNIQNFVEQTSGFTNTTSRLKISLVEYLGPTQFACDGSNIYEKTNATMTINKNLVVNQNRAFRFPDLSQERNYSNSMNYCRLSGSHLAKIPDNQTQNTLATAATKFELKKKIYIGAQKFEEGGSSIWRWLDQSFLYNQTEHKSWQGNETGVIVDGAYVAWGENKPSLVGACLAMHQNKDWQWINIDCSRTRLFICEKYVAGIPQRFETRVDECSSNITINWTPAAEAIGIRHKIDIKELDANLTEAFTDNFTPKYQNEIIVKSFTNLKRWTSYSITITVCPEVCPYPSVSAKTVTTHAGIPERVFLANVTQLSKTCLIKWKMKSLTGVTGFMLIALSTLMHVESENYAEKFFKEKHNVTNTSDMHNFNYKLNRNYTFSIQAETCAGAGLPLNAYGTCETPTGPPNEVLSPWVAPLSNADDTVDIIITFPDETNGPISCIFVIVVYKPNRSSEEDITTLKNLQIAMTNAQTPSLSANDAYIAIAISRSNINKGMIEEMNFTKTLGDDSLSSCNLTKSQKSLRKKRETSTTTTTLQAKNLKLENNANYSYYTLSTTPGDNGIVHYKSSQRSFFEKIGYSKQNDEFPIFIVIVPVITFVILLLVAIIIVRHRKNRGKHHVQPDELSMTDFDSAPQEQTYANIGTNISEPKSETEISLKRLLEVYNFLRDNDCAKFYEQFEKLKQTAKSLEYPTTVASAVSLRRKNRYKNILPSDYSSVKLKGEGDSRYINACYISGFSKPKKFIATQGPLPTTVIDFWRMILEQKVQVIVMLTKCMENGKRKCEKYWPDQGISQRYDDMAVTNIEEVSLECFKMRKIRISKDNQETTLHQMQFLHWPDHGVPVSTTNLIRFCEAVKKHEMATDGPIVVHCSAGAGRTGAFIAYDFLLEESESFGSVDVYGCVLALREQRVDMVQTCEQYMIVHKLLLENYLFGITDMDPREMKRMEESSSNAAMEKQFDDLSTVGPINQIRFGHGEKISAMNRNSDIVPYERSHVMIERIQEDVDFVYVNASYIEIYGDVVKLIAAQGPLENTVEYFWRAILDNNVNTIVMLTNCTEKKKEQCHQYWPEEKNTALKVRDMTIHLRAEDAKESIVRREILVRVKDDEKIIVQYHYTKWKSNKCPDNASDVLQIIEKMKSCLERDEFASVLVHCSDGAGRTGAFCAIINLIERLVSERRIDVFRAVKDLRDCRPGMVQTLDQYRFCFKAVSEYFASFSVYANIVQVEEDHIEENLYENI